MLAFRFSKSLANTPVSQLFTNATIRSFSMSLSCVWVTIIQDATDIPRQLRSFESRVQVVSRKFRMRKGRLNMCVYYMYLSSGPAAAILC